MQSISYLRTTFILGFRTFSERSCPPAVAATQDIETHHPTTPNTSPLYTHTHTPSPQLFNLRISEPSQNVLVLPPSLQHKTSKHTIPPHSTPHRFTLTLSHSPKNTKDFEASQNVRVLPPSLQHFYVSYDSRGGDEGAWLFISLICFTLCSGSFFLFIFFVYLCFYLPLSLSHTHSLSRSVCE